MGEKKNTGNYKHSWELWWDAVWRTVILFCISMSHSCLSNQGKCCEFSAVSSVGFSGVLAPNMIMAPFLFPRETRHERLNKDQNSQYSNSFFPQTSWKFVALIMVTFEAVSISTLWKCQFPECDIQDVMLNFSLQGHFLSIWVYTVFTAMFT